MADFSFSGIESLPPTTWEALKSGGDPRVLGWLREAVQEGDRLNRSDPMYDRIEVGQNYIAGMQRASDGNLPYLPQMILNKSGKIVKAHVSLLTDLKPLFAYKATNPTFTPHADLLNKLTVAWWITTMADLELGHVIKFSLAGGTGDCLIEWDPNFGDYGDIRIQARDSRDTLPWRPAPQSRDIQDWEGLILREAHTVNSMRGKYPQFAEAFKPTTDSLLSTLMGRFRQAVSRLVSPAMDTLSGLNVPATSQRVRSGEVLLYRTYLNDRTRNLTTKPIPMGDPSSSWSYVVQPGDYLYPYKRLVLATPEMILYDGPSTYWHGQYPLARLKLWDLPWLGQGVPILNDLIPIQDAINEGNQDVRLGLKKWLNPAVSYDRGAVSSSFMRLFDARRPGQKVQLNQAGMKEGFKIHEGPPAQVLTLAQQYVESLKNDMDDLSGTPNLTALLALRQLPGADTIQKYWESLTPELRQEGRMVEAFLRPVADQMKMIRFQYETNAKRVAVLGDAGLLLDDFDFDPGQLIPAMAPTDQFGQPTPGYVPQFDASKPRDQRAMALAKTIVFMVAPNSILSMNATEQKLIRLQLARGGMLDFWSLLEALEIPNVGQPPPMPLPPISLEKAQQEIGMMLLQPNGAELIKQKYIIDPMTGQILEMRVPSTITERLMAQNMIGIGMSENPAGRKASGGASPSVEQKSDGRTTVTESRHESGPGSD